MSDDSKPAEPSTQWPAPPPFAPDLDLIGDLERGQRAALDDGPSRRRRRRFWHVSKPA